MAQDDGTDIADGQVDLESLYTAENIGEIEYHLEHQLEENALDPKFHPYNPAMIERQRGIMNGDLDPTEQDINWMRHELKESELVKQKVPYEEAHRAANESIGIGPKDDWELWPTEMIERFRGSLSNSHWLEKIQDRK